MVNQRVKKQSSQSSLFAFTYNPRKKPFLGRLHWASTDREFKGYHNYREKKLEEWKKPGKEVWQTPALDISWSGKTHKLLMLYFALLQITGRFSIYQWDGLHY